MPGLVVAALLVLSLALVHLSLRAQPMPKDRPLDVDEGLPLPELAQSSTVFSLTALFGAYFGIAIALGIPALTGLAFGTVLGLLLIRYWIDKKRPERFENFLLDLLKGNRRNAAVYTFVISTVQCAYATSELLILRELAKVALGLRSEQATLLAIGVGLTGYFYMLFGGYRALFVTDVVQVVLVSLMAIVSGAFLLIRNSQAGWIARLLPRPGFWEIPLLGPSRWLYLYHFILAAVMGMGFLLASPDSWKRVFQVGKRKTSHGVRTLILVGVGILPYLVLLPFAIAANMSSGGGPIKRGAMLSPSQYGNFIFAGAALGLVASFLSSFDSALVASVHIQLMLRRKKVGVKNEEAGFYWRMVTVLLTICSLFVAARLMFSNPWLLGNLLMGMYAAIAGVQIGTRGDISRLPENSLHWVFALGFVGWFLYFVYSPGFSEVPTLYSVNTVPAGVCVFFATAILSKLLIFGGRKNAR
jgi:hypothetical protein